MEKKPHPSDMQDRYIVRLPDGMRDDLKAAAARSNRTLNAEIVARLQGSFGLNIWSESVEVERMKTEASLRLKVESLTIQRAGFAQSLLGILKSLQDGQDPAAIVEELREMERHAQFAVEQQRKEEPEGLIQELREAQARMDRLEAILDKPAAAKKASKTPAKKR